MGHINHSRTKYIRWCYASAADINLIDGITNGTVIASKAIITDANKDITVVET
ncbi:MAG: hypothetical protein CM15mV50_240 [uncultured marine virus]|nr:MAG: hypothetical protein CM15mV50_240 [uncultured marine virus]